MENAFKNRRRYGRFNLCFIFLLTFFCANSQDSSNLKIVIIRHGEKYDSNSNLNCKGFNRALNIPSVIKNQFGSVQFIYVPTIKTGDSTSEDRMFQTATPLAIRDTIAINSKYKETDTKKLADALKTKKGTLLVVWEHTNIPKLAHHLGLKDSLSWSGSDFDSIWIITFPAGIKNKPQLSISAEGLNSLPDTCSFSVSRDSN